VVFPHGDLVLFQVYGDRWRGLVDAELIMHNENVVDFRLYSAIAFSELLLFVEGLGTILSRRIPAPGPLGGAATRSYNIGFETFIDSLSSYALAAQAKAS